MMRVLIADDHELFLKGLEFILSDFDDDMSFISARSYTDIRKILEKDKKFDLVLTDLAMPGGNWLEEIDYIHKALPDTPIIILSAVFDKEIVQKTIENGVSGYIPKTSSNEIILGAIHLVKSGGVYIPPELLNATGSQELNELKTINTDNGGKEENQNNSNLFTPRQIDVLKRLAKGESNKMIAYELGLSEGTVKLHVTAILKILKVYNRTGAVIEAAKRGIISQNDISV